MIKSKSFEDNFRVLKNFMENKKNACVCYSSLSFGKNFGENFFLCVENLQRTSEIGMIVFTLTEINFSMKYRRREIK